MNVTTEQARIMSDWWTSRLLGAGETRTMNDTERYRALVGSNNYERAPLMAENMLADLRASAKDRVSKEQAATFNEALFNALDRMEYRPECRLLNVDYDPCALLANAMRKAGLDPHCISTLPPKTSMQIDGEGKVIVSEGYGMPWVEVINTVVLVVDGGE